MIAVHVLVCSECGRAAPPNGAGCGHRAEIVAPSVWLQRLRTKVADQADRADRLRQAGMCPHCRQYTCTCY